MNWYCRTLEPHTRLERALENRGARPPVLDKGISARSERCKPRVELHDDDVGRHAGGPQVPGAASAHSVIPETCVPYRDSD
jgi:hypothetical protein